MFERLLRYPVLFILGAILIIFGGLSSLRQLPVDLFPSLNYPLINIITHYPAGTAEDLEQLVTRPIENAMLGLQDLRRVSSSSAPGFSQITVEFNWGVDAMQARQLVYGRLAQVSDSLPAAASPELENIGSTLATLSTYTLQGGDPVALRSWTQYQLAPTLSTLQGVSKVDVFGGGEMTWRVDLDPLKLQQTGLSAQAISKAIEASNELGTGGYLEKFGRDLLIRVDGRLHKQSDIEHILLQTPSGKTVKLGSVAHIYAGTLPQRYVVSTDRLPAVAFTIQKQPNASTLDVSAAVDEALAKLKLPQDVRLQKFYDQAEIIGLAYRNMRNQLLMGAILAIISVLFILGNNRASWVIAITFPLAIFGTLWSMHALGLGLNLMTLGALTVAIGMVADDAIVVLENIDRHRNLGEPPWQAALKGTREILGADIAGTLTVLAAFAPLVIVSGLAGRLFHPFGISFSILLLFSLLLSVTVIPLAAAHWMRPASEVDTHKAPLGSHWVNGLQKINLKLLDHFMLHRKLTLFLSGLVLTASLLLLIFNPIRFLPLLDESSLLLSYQLAPGTSLQESNRVGDHLEQQILAVSGVKSVFRRTGSPEASFYLEGPDEGELVIRLVQKQSVNALAVKADLDKLLANMPGVIGRVNEPTTEKLDESFSGLPALFGITVFANDLEGLYQTASRVEAAAKKTPGLLGVVNNTKIPVDQILIQLDAKRMAVYGVRASDAVETVQLVLQGKTATELIQNQRTVGVYLRFAKKDRDQLADVKRITVNNVEGEPIPLSQIATITPTSSHPVIEHQHGRRSLTMTAEIDGNPFTVIKALDKAIADLNLPTGTQVSYTGEYQQLIDTGLQMIWVLIGSALLVYGIITLQLGNMLDPLVVLVKLPLDFMGAAIALFLTHQELDLTVMIGFITLIGVSTNNGIMLLTFTRKFREQGMDAVQAVREAAKLRTRPMILTHLTTLLALIPASLGLGDGPQLLQPLGIMLFGGLTAGTLLTLNLLPVIYVSMEKWRKT